MVRGGEKFNVGEGAFERALKEAQGKNKSKEKKKKNRIKIKNKKGGGDEEREEVISDVDIVGEEEINVEGTTVGEVANPTKNGQEGIVAGSAEASPAILDDSNIFPEMQEACRRFLNKKEETFPVVTTKEAPKKGEKSPPKVPEKKKVDAKDKNNATYKERRKEFDKKLEDQKDILWGILRNRITRGEIDARAKQLLGNKGKLVNRFRSGKLSGNLRERIAKIIQQAERELIAEVAKEFLVERIKVMHRRGQSEKEGWEEGERVEADLDAQCALGVLSLAGIDISKGFYVPQGELKMDGAMNIDTGMFSGIGMGRIDLLEKIEKDNPELKTRIDEKKEEEKLEDEVREIKEEVLGLLLKLDGMAEGEEKERKKIEVSQKQDLLAIKIKALKEKSKKESTVIDHHGEDSHRDTSATQIMFELLRDFGLLDHITDEREKHAIKELVKFVTEMDNAKYGKEEYRGIKNFKESHHTMLGLKTWVTFDNLLKFFRDGKLVTDILDDEDLKKYGVFNYVDKEGKTISCPEKQSGRISWALRKIEKLEKDNNWVFWDGDSGDKFLVDFPLDDEDNGQGTGTLGPWAAASLGYAGLLRYTPERGFAFFKSNGEFDLAAFKKLSQGFSVRGGMFLQPLDKEKLLVNLGDLMGKIAPKYEITKGSNLEKFLENEERIIKKKIKKSPYGYWEARKETGELIIVEKVPQGINDGDEVYLKILNPRKAEKATKKEEQRKGYAKKYYLAEWEAPMEKKVEKEEDPGEKEEDSGEKKEETIIKNKIHRAGGAYWWVAKPSGERVIVNSKTLPNGVREGDEVFVKVLESQKGPKKKANQNQKERPLGTLGYPDEYYLGEWVPGTEREETAEEIKKRISREFFEVFKERKELIEAIASMSEKGKKDEKEKEDPKKEEMKRRKVELDGQYNKLKARLEKHVDGERRAELERRIKGGEAKRVEREKKQKDKKEERKKEKGEKLKAEKGKRDEDRLKVLAEALFVARENKNSGAEEKIENFYKEIKKEIEKKLETFYEGFTKKSEEELENIFGRDIREKIAEYKEKLGVVLANEHKRMLNEDKEEEEKKEEFKVLAEALFVARKKMEEATEELEQRKDSWSERIFKRSKKRKEKVERDLRAVEDTLKDSFGEDILGDVDEHKKELDGENIDNVIDNLRQSIFGEAIQKKLDEYKRKIDRILVEKKEAVLAEEEGRKRGEQFRKNEEKEDERQKITRRQEREEKKEAEALQGRMTYMRSLSSQGIDGGLAKPNPEIGKVKRDMRIFLEEVRKSDQKRAEKYERYFTAGNWED